MSIKHPMSARYQSPCLLTLPPAEILGLALTQFLNCGRSQRQSRTRKLAAWVEAPTHRAEAASSRATEKQRDAAAPRLPASSSPSSESPRERCGFPAGPLTALAAQCSKRALSSPPQGSQRGGHGEPWSQDTVWLQVIHQQIPKESQSSITSSAP